MLLKSVQDRLGDLVALKRREDILGKKITEFSLVGLRHVGGNPRARPWLLNSPDDLEMEGLFLNKKLEEIRAPESREFGTQATGLSGQHAPSI
jgi:hypothetical protein